MARGDGKAQRGYTRGKGVIKMAAGGNLAARDAAMGGAAVGSRAEATRSTSGGFGGQTSRAEPGGIGGGGGGGRDASGRPSGGSAAGQIARLGPNTAEAMTQAGVNSGRAQMLSGILGGQVYGPGPRSFSPSGKITDRIPDTTDFSDVVRPGAAPYSLSKPLQIDTTPVPFNPMDLFNRQNVQMRHALVSPTGFRGTLGEQPMPIASEIQRLSPVRTGSFGTQTQRAEAGFAPKQITDRIGNEEAPYGLQTARAESRLPSMQITRTPQTARVEPRLPSKQIYDRIAQYPEAAPPDTLGSFGSAATRSIASAAPPASPYGTPKFRSSYEDQQSIVPGSVTFKQASTFTPFAQTPTGQELLDMSKKPMTAEQAKALQEKFPPGSAFYAQPGKGIFDLQNVAAAQYPAPKNLSGLDTYPATIDGYKFNVGIPKNAGSDVPYGPKIGQFNAAPTPQKTQSQTGSVGTQTPRAEASFTPKPKAKSASTPTKKATPKEGSVFVKDGVRYQIRGGKAYNFNVPGGRSKEERRFGEREPGGLRNKRDGGVISKSDGAATRGKTRGRYI